LLANERTFEINFLQNPNKWKNVISRVGGRGPADRFSGFLSYAMRVPLPGETLFALSEKKTEVDARHVQRPGLLVFWVFLALCVLSDLVSWKIFDVDDAKFFMFSLKVQIMSENELFFLK
jgi:hypothetical protein